MSFDERTNAIALKEDGDFLADSGSLFLKMLRDLGSDPQTPATVAADWARVAAWLGCEKRELTPDDYERFGLVFRSYLAQGMAPSAALVEPFKQFAAMAKAEAWRLVPVPEKLIPVFKRLLASDQEIREKSAKDALGFAAATRSLNVPTRRNPEPRNVPVAVPAVKVSWIPLAVSAAMLLLASGLEWPYGFYQLLRLVVAGSAGYVVLQTIGRREYWPWVMGGIGILFNPVLPISFEREEWQSIDFGVALVFASGLVQTLRGRL